MDKPNQRSPKSPFQTLVTDSKLIFLGRAIEQYDQAQLHLRQNQDHQRRVRHFMEYTNMRLLQLDRARQLIIQSSNRISDGNVGIAYPHLPTPIPERADTLQDVMKPRMNIQHSLPLQRRPLHTADVKVTRNPAKFLTKQSNGLMPQHTRQNNDSHTKAGTQETLENVSDKVSHHTNNEDPDCILQIRTSANSAIPNTMTEPAKTELSKDEDMYSSNQDSIITSPHPPTTADAEFSPQKSKASMMTSSTSDDGGETPSEDDSTTDPLSKILRKDLYWRYTSFNFHNSDVLFERGNFAYNHPGNKVYRDYIKSMQDEYIRCHKNDKHTITTKVMNYIKNLGGRFLAFDTEGSGNWGELSDHSARRKISQSLREKNKRFMPPPRSRKNNKQT